jgi:hypothetical protein
VYKYIEEENTQPRVSVIMALTRLDNLYSSKTGKYLYVSPDDFNATDELDNRGNSPLRPFKTIQRAFLEVARFSYLPGKDNDRFDQFSIMLMPGDHYIDNRPGLVDFNISNRERFLDSRNLITANRDEIIDRAFAQIMIDYREDLWGTNWVVPGDDTTDEFSRYKDAYRLIQKNRQEIITTAYAEIAIQSPTFVNPDPAKCQRDIGYFVDAVSLDISLGGANKYTRKFLQNYFTGNTWKPNTLEGEEVESNIAFNKAKALMKQAVANQLTYKDLTITPDPSYGSNTNPAACGNVQTSIDTLGILVTSYITQGNIDDLNTTAPENVPEAGAGMTKCKRDIGYIVDAVASDVANGGNASIIAATKAYFNSNGTPISNGLIGEESQSIIAFNAARDMMQKAVTNQLYFKDLTVPEGPAVIADGGPPVPNLPSGNPNAYIDVQTRISTLVSVITSAIEDGNLTNLAELELSGDIPVFFFDQAKQEWNDQSVLDLSNPDNVLYKFNASTGGAIVPRGCSLVGYDLRRTIVRPLYVPDPADGTQGRTSIFNLTGGCYIWQFTIKDGDLSENSPLYDANDRVGKVYFQKGNNSQLAIPEYSHHKITIMEYAEDFELEEYYRKVATSFSLFQPTIDDGDFEALPQENRIVGPLSDTRSIVNLRLVSQSVVSGKDVTLIEATTKIPHGYFVGQSIAIIDSGLNELLNGTFKVISVDDEDPKIFSYQVEATPTILGLDINSEGYDVTTTPALSVNCRGQAEIDSVESASPYVFNCSIRSTWGLCGMWANGAKATGFRSMVVAQYTGVSLQRDDRAFIRYDEFSNTWNQASLIDAFATVPYHTKGDAYWKDEWKNFHIRASNDAFIQCVSVFAVGFFDHFLMESGGDMSITNSNSNFGNTSLHAIGFKGFAFNQDKGGYITDIIPVKEVEDSEFNLEDQKYYSIAIQPTKDPSNKTKLYYGTDEAYNPFEKPATSINGYRLGAKTAEKLFVKIKSNVGTTVPFNTTLSPTGFKRYTVSLQTLNPDGITINNFAQDAANLIEDNKVFIQKEAYGYITAKYPDLLTNTNITISKCERDIGYFVDAVVKDLRLGGNINTIEAAEGYYIGGQLAYIQNELNESLEAYDYVKNLCIAAMRNFDYLIRSCNTIAGSAIVDIGDTTGIVIGMKATQYEFNTTNFTNGRLNSGATPITTAIPAGAYVKRILDSSRIELGIQGSYLNTGTTVPANISTGSAYIYFELPKTTSIVDSENNLSGIWSSVNAKRDPTVVQDAAAWEVDAPDGYPECSGVATSIIGYFTNIALILSQGLTPVDKRNEDTSNLISANKELIAKEALDRVLDANPGFSFDMSNSDFLDNVLESVDALAFNVKFGSNNRVYDHAKIYVDQPSLLNGQRSEADQVYILVRDLAIQVIRNQTITIEGSHGLTQVKDLNVVDEDNQGNPVVPAFQDIASIITSLSAIITSAIGTDANPGDLIGIVKTVPQFTNITRVEPVLDTANLAARSTIFTVNTGGGVSNPHNFETGTAVRLVPKARAGTNPDKRVIRLPRGFEPNTIYYVIAPGRRTTPEDYSNPVKYQDIFTSAASTRLMLASTKENAAAGIYIYSSETDAIDPEVEIELQQYVLDDSYDLHQYLCNFATGQTDVIQTDVAHIFDVPGSINTVQKVFFRTLGDPSESELPQISSGGVNAQIDPNRYYFARYVTNKTFAVFETASQAIAGTPRITFTPGFGKNFYVFSDKRESPVRFDATLQNEDTTTGQWYINVLDETSDPTNIIARFQELGDTLKDSRSKNTFFTRLIDDRTKEDRTYRLRFVIPQYADGVRDPLNGFVLKARTDTTRKLLPQRIVLSPVSSGSPDVAYFEIQIPTEAGGTITQQLGLPKDELDPSFVYDPYDITKVKTVDSDRTSSKVSFSIQSARKVTVSGDERLELTVFDHTITNDALRNETFVTVKIEAPQEGTFRSTEGFNTITWNGNSSGSAVVQAYFNVPETNENYLVLRAVNGSIVYNPLVDTTFFQPLLDVNNEPVLDNDDQPVQIFAKLIKKPNSVGSINESLSKSEKADYLYSNKDANVLTVTPGDIIEDDDATQYRVISVEDAGDIEDSFYIFDINEIQRRIPNQQEGIYYLTCIKGNVSPFPTGAGVGTNFRNFKFSQPISQLYPLDYKNDPLWFQVRPDGTRDTTLTDVPATICAADNYVHGLVRTNDFKNSETKEVVLDLINNPALDRYDYTALIAAQSGNATSGSEDRMISISGNSVYPTENRLYVELRRPSIARSGNHTFEYLGFGPGNYSTGFPLRQEVVLSDVQDFYAQAKREDGGIVFYTGLNSNGDLYIGNRKINAITGEETFLERAELVSSDDDGGDLGNLVTTFELPVVFERDITVDGDATFNNPVTINVEPNEPNALTIVSNIDANSGEDTSLDSATFALSNIESEGNITLHKNRIYAAIYSLNPRGSVTIPGQNYSFRTHIDQTNGNLPSNITPNQTISSLGRQVQFGTQSPKAGDILLKGVEVGKTGSLGWIFANFYTNKTSEVFTVTAAGNLTVTFTMKVGVTPLSVGIAQGSELKLTGFIGRFEPVNGIRTVVSTTATTFTINTQVIVAQSPSDPTRLDVDQINALVEVATVTWKEVGVIGAEALRTNTDEYGDYRLGINTFARADHLDNLQGFVSTATKPRANLDVVGTAFVSGKTLATTPVNNFVSNPLASNRTFNNVGNAFLVGGDSLNPDSTATLRVATTNSGRVGINTNLGNLDRTLVVTGNARITDDLRLQNNLEVNGGNITTTKTSFNLAVTNATSASAFSSANQISFGTLAPGPQTFVLGINPSSQKVDIGTFTPDGEFNVHTNTTKSIVNIGTTDNTSTASSCVVTLGGAWARNSNSRENGSVLVVRNRYTELDGDLSIGTGLLPGVGIARIQSNALQVELFTLNTSRLEFATGVGRLNIGSKGGNTTINNSLIVEANTTMKGDVTHQGGLNAGQYQIRRGSFSTPTTSHVRGSIDNTNIDFFSRVTIDRTIDTQGASLWTGSEFIVDSDDPSEYFLPIGEVSTNIQFEVGAYLLIDRSVAVPQQNTTVSPVGEQYSELLLVTELTNLNNVSDLPLRVKVKRARNLLDVNGNMIVDGTSPSGFKYLRNDHPDNAIIIRYNLSENVSFVDNANGLANGAVGALENLSTGVFSGTVKQGDIFRLTDSELTFINAINLTSPQRFIINDGGNPAVNVFTVESTSGDTEILGNLTVNKDIRLLGSNTENNQRLVIKDQSDNEKFVVDSATGKTYIFGNLNVGNSTSYDRLVVNSSNGNTTIRGGDLLITANSIGTQKLFLQNSTGNLTISGLFTSQTTSGENVFNTDLKVNGDNLTFNKVLNIGGEDTEVNLFKVRWIEQATNRPSGGAIDFAGQQGFFTQTGARKWTYVQAGQDVIEVQSNVNYFVSPTATTILKLPTNPLTGDTIRVVDVGGNLTFNVSLKFRAPSGVAIQGDTTNAGGTPDPGTLYNGGELVVQTPNAGLGLVYIGPVNYDGTSTGAPASQQGWWLMEI